MGIRVPSSIGVCTVRTTHEYCIIANGVCEVVAQWDVRLLGCGTLGDVVVLYVYSTGCGGDAPNCSYVTRRVAYRERKLWTQYIHIYFYR